ncbi:MAG: hypothetical protein R2830_07190 [Saprospiraceae bacterium]
MDTVDLQKFQRSLLENGIIGYSQSDLKFLYNTAKICARTAGIPAAGGAAVLAAGTGSVVIPGIGAVPGYLAGALAGFVGGTLSCTVARGSLKRGLDDLLKNK